MVQILNILMALIFAENQRACTGSPTGGVNDLATGNQASLSQYEGNPKIGLRLYQPDADQPSCMGHGIILETKNQRHLPHRLLESSEWAKFAVHQHNQERIRLGYSPIQLSEKLSGVSLDYAKLLELPLVHVKNELKLNSDISSVGLKTKVPFDMFYEDTYYNEALRFQAPDLDSVSFRTCCPAPFTRFLSNETREIGLSRVIHNVAGNFKRLTIVAVFKPKSTNWESSGLCESDPEILGNAMHDTSEYVDGDYEEGEEAANLQAELDSWSKEAFQI